MYVGTCRNMNTPVCALFWGGVYGYVYCTHTVISYSWLSKCSLAMSWIFNSLLPLQLSNSYGLGGLFSGVSFSILQSCWKTNKSKVNIAFTFIWLKYLFISANWLMFNQKPPLLGVETTIAIIDFTHNNGLQNSKEYYLPKIFPPISFPQTQTHTHNVQCFLVSLHPVQQHFLLPSMCHLIQCEW